MSVDLRLLTTYGVVFLMDLCRLGGTPLDVLTWPYTFRAGRNCGRVIPGKTDKRGCLEYEIKWQAGGVLIPRRREGVRVYHYYDDLYLALRSRHHTTAFEDCDEGFVMLGERELVVILRDLQDYRFLSPAEKAAVTRGLAKWSVCLETAQAERKVEAHKQVTAAIERVDRRGRENPGVRRTHVVAGGRRLKLRAEDVRRILGFNGLWLIALTKELRRHEALVAELLRWYRHLQKLTLEHEPNLVRIEHGLDLLRNRLEEWTARPYVVLRGKLFGEIDLMEGALQNRDVQKISSLAGLGIGSLRLKELRITGERIMTRFSLLLAAKKFGPRAQAGFLERVGKLQERLRTCSDVGMRRPSLKRCHHRLAEVRRLYRVAKESGDAKDWEKVKGAFKKALHCL